MQKLGEILESGVLLEHSCASIDLVLFNVIFGSSMVSILVSNFSFTRTRLNVGQEHLAEMWDSSTRVADFSKGPVTWKRLDIRCICLKLTCDLIELACNLESTDTRAKQTEIWDILWDIFKIYMGTFVLVFKIIWGSFRALVPTWPVTQ